MSVIKDSGVRAPIPPFTEEHAALRDSVTRFVAKEIAPHVDDWEAAREFPRELYERRKSAGSIRIHD